MYKKIISVALAMLLVLGIANSFAFADERLLYDQDGVTTRYRMQGEMDPHERDRARPVRSGGENDNAHLDYITIFNQSTYGKRTPGKYYYRTVGYQIALLDKDLMPVVEDGIIPTNPLGTLIADDLAIDRSMIVDYLLGRSSNPGLPIVIEYNIRGKIDTKYFDTNSIRLTEQKNMWKLIEERLGDAAYDEPVVTSMTISRERLIRELGLHGREFLIDQAQYLVMAGEVEFYKTNTDGTEGPAFSSTRTKVMYNPMKRKLVSYFDVPDIYKDYRDDIQTRMQLINLETGEITFITEDELPDLIVEKIDPGTTQAKPGAKNNGKVIIRRAAESGAMGAMDTTLYLTIANGKIVGSADIPVTLAPGEVNEIAFTWEAGEDKNKDVLIVAEINPARLNANRIIEKTYDNNIKQATVKMEEDKIDLSVDLSSWTDALFAGETDVFEAIVRNTASKAVTTDIVWRFGGKEVRRASITVPAKGHIFDRANITMPSSTKENTLVQLEVEVNSSRTKPSNETTYANNKATERILCLGIDDDGSGGGGIDPPYLVK